MTTQERFTIAPDSVEPGFYVVEDAVRGESIATGLTLEVAYEEALRHRDQFAPALAEEVQRDHDRGDHRRCDASCEDQGRTEPRFDRAVADLDGPDSPVGDQPFDRGYGVPLTGPVAPLTRAERPQDGDADGWTHVYDSSAPDQTRIDDSSVVDPDEDQPTTSNPEFDAYLRRREAEDGGTHSRTTGIAHND